VVNHEGFVTLVDPQAGTIAPASPEAFTDHTRLYAIPIGPDGRYLGRDLPPPVPPKDISPEIVDAYRRAVERKEWEAYDVLLQERLDAYPDLNVHQYDVANHRMRLALANGEDVPVPGTLGRLVQSFCGLRWIGPETDPVVLAQLAATLMRDVVAITRLVIGPGDVEPRELRFPPKGRPLPVTA
jgi:hypothetical protein